MRVDTSSRPASFCGMMSEKENMLKWFEEYKKLDESACMEVEECDVYKNSDIVFYFSSLETLKDIQFYATMAKANLYK